MKSVYIIQSFCVCVCVCASNVECLSAFAIHHIALRSSKSFAHEYDVDAYCSWNSRVGKLNEALSIGNFKLLFTLIISISVRRCAFASNSIPNSFTSHQIWLFTQRSQLYSFFCFASALQTFLHFSSKLQIRRANETYEASSEKWVVFTIENTIWMERRAFFCVPKLLFPSIFLILCICVSSVADGHFLLVFLRFNQIRKEFSSCSNYWVNYFRCISIDFAGKLMAS